MRRQINKKRYQSDIVKTNESIIFLKTIITDFFTPSPIENVALL